MAECNQDLINAGKPNPRTCALCGLGPCIKLGGVGHEIKALGPQAFLSTTEEDHADAVAMVTTLNAALRDRNPDLRSNGTVALDVPEGWHKARAAVRDSVLGAFRSAGWMVTTHDDQRDGMSIVLGWSAVMPR